MAGVVSKPSGSGKYRFWFKDCAGKRVFRTGGRSKTETRRMAERLEDDHLQIRLGYRPPPRPADKFRARPVSAVCDEYIAWGEAQGGRNGRPWAKAHAGGRRFQLAWWRKELELETIADFEGILRRVESALQGLQHAGKSGRTVQNYAEALRALCRWCLDRGYLDANPLAKLRAFDTTPQTRRRAMTDAEIHALLESCPPERRLLYKTALCSGLRVNELRQLKVMDLDGDQGGLHLRAEWTKNRQSGFQPLHPTLMCDLTESIRGAEPTAPLLHMRSHPVRDLDSDLAAASISKWTAEGKLDFHALRTAYISRVVESGASVKEAQTLARHSTAELTLNTYARARSERLAQVAEEAGEPIVGEKCAMRVHREAVGAEGLRIISFNDNELRETDLGRGDRIRTCDLVNPIHAL